jgi:hypothetical protein
MEEILERLNFLEKRLAILEKREQSNCNNFKDTIVGIQLTEDDVSSALQSSIEEQIIRLLVEANNKTPFLKLKKILYKFDNDWVKLSDDDFKYMFEYIEYKLITLYKLRTHSFGSEEFFEKNKIMYGLNFNKNNKRIKSLFLQSL